MNRLWIPFLAVLVSGCGPLDQPLPVRPDDAGQNQIDDAWDRALSPVGKHDRQQWLDLLVGTRAYQVGVDTLSFRSEKKFAGGKVVMEVFYDRAKPADDRFVVTVYDHAGNQVRNERYDRALVDETSRVLFDHRFNTPASGPEPAGLARERAAHEARWKAIEAAFPGSHGPDRSPDAR